MTFNTIKSFKLEFDGPGDAVYASSEILSGKVVLELNRDTKVDSMKVLGRGVATAHWLENRSGGMNAVYNDYTSKISYFRKRQHLIRAPWTGRLVRIKGKMNRAKYRDP
uniref:Arrestin-like N-terminal domain-containing protein n=1 Tax=Oncorhynchus tshawytscha TaxID=74940 RepID=A0AAZ3SDI1_ONCTS